jgi:hypothetical protein
MKARVVTLPDLAVIAATRGMLGAGIGLLTAGRLNSVQRRRMGLILTAVGIASMIPLARRVIGRVRSTGPALPG